jgi:two-component system, OmpR family, alkaline phosphatase synthesis response regulator PhoP
MGPERPTILLVEDDRTLARGLVMNLELEGFRVLHAATGDRGLALALEGAPDLVVLDLMLPGLNGFDLVAQLRQRARPTPVVVLSARSATRDKVDALGLGADDYLTKPFSLKELVARIRAGLRRRTWEEAPRERRERFGEVEVWVDRRTVTREGEEVALTAKEFDLLAFFVAHPGRVYSRQQLLDAVWGFDYEGTTRTVDNFVRSLRVKLERDPGRPRHLATVRGAGYRFDG